MLSTINLGILVPSGPRSPHITYQWSAVTKCSNMPIIIYTISVITLSTCMFIPYMCRCVFPWTAGGYHIPVE